ncbi:MAG TPA: SDR family oxidoreductase [Thermoanaerobaculaceae bacterium]|nr:SDR family oxidoreductase [Thermoanaerobaculaceae bacterium]
MDFDGRVAFITGASRGVGKCLALALARAGADVVVAAKSIEENPRLPGTIHATAAEVEALGRRALAVQVDVRDERAVDAGVKAALDRFGRVDILVNNAGALYWQPLAETPMSRFDRVMAVNVRGAFACCRAVLPAMVKQRWGHILMMSPPVDPPAAAGKIAYAASKFGMTLITHGLAGELAGENVACNALWPATLIESYATINFGLGGPAAWRKPDILADAALRIFAKEPASFTGHALIDEDFLRAEGVTDFTSYRCDPASEPPRVGFDFRFQAG